MSELNSVGFIIKSNVNNQCFKVDKNIIDASILLKNLCDLTKVTEPVIVECSGQSIDTFIKVISHYVITDSHDTEFEKSLYNYLNDEELVELVKDLSILDSKIFVDSVADYILGKISAMDNKKIQEYLGLEDDYTSDERALIDKNYLEYFLGITNFGNGTEISLPEKCFYSLKTNFNSPLNVLLASIVERSDERISYHLALINKTLKKEVDRYLIKISTFASSGTFWRMEISKIVKFIIEVEEHDQNIFNIIKKRKVIAQDFSIIYSGNIKYNKANILCSSFNFAIPTKFQKVEICFQANLLQYFDITICPFHSIFYTIQGRVALVDDEIDFKTNIYDHLILKDLSKEIELYIQKSFNYLSSPAHMRLFKKPHHSKFYRLDVRCFTKIGPEFEAFINNFKDDDDDSVINLTQPLKGIPQEKCTRIKKGGYYSYKISFIKQYLECITSIN